jgi:AcrR family transcriptional regulator
VDGYDVKCYLAPVTTELSKVDPRIRRTREMLFEAFRTLLAEKTFDSISVRDIAGRSTLNRATFYDHFTDKFALLEAMMGERLSALIDSRMKKPPPDCEGALKQLILAACDFLAEVSSGCQKQQRQFEPLVESQMKRVMRETLLTALRAHGMENPELKATMVTWAIAGAALDWSRKKKPSAEEFADAILPMAHAPLDVPSRARSAARGISN